MARFVLALALLAGCAHAGHRIRCDDVRAAAERAPCDLLPEGRRTKCEAARLIAFELCLEDTDTD